MAEQTRSFRITGMTCGHCEMTVAKTIRSLGEGVHVVNVDLKGGSASVTFDDSRVTPQQIVDVINHTEIYIASVA